MGANVPVLLEHSILQSTDMRPKKELLQIYFELKIATLNSIIFYTAAVSCIPINVLLFDSHNSFEYF